jgi:hypothetical protein
MPDVSKHTHTFGNEWQAWYTGLQPKRRLLNNPGGSQNTKLDLDQNPPVDLQLSDWNEIRKGSQNGFFLLLLTLGWWGVGASDESSQELERWGEAFDDLRRVLEILISEDNNDDESDELESLPLKKR